MGLVLAGLPVLSGKLHYGAAIGMGVFAIYILLIVLQTSSHFWKHKAIVVIGPYCIVFFWIYWFSGFLNSQIWPLQKEAVYVRIDMINICLAIAGSFMPARLLFPQNIQRLLGSMVSLITVAGILSVLFFQSSPLLWWGYLLFGWGCGTAIAVRAWQVKRGLWLLLCVGIVYTTGGIIYKLQEPNMAPAILGWHNTFHVFTIGAQALYLVFICVYILEIKFTWKILRRKIRDNRHD